MEPAPDDAPSPLAPSYRVHALAPPPAPVAEPAHAAAAEDCVSSPPRDADLRVEIEALREAVAAKDARNAAQQEEIAALRARVAAQDAKLSSLRQ